MQRDSFHPGLYCPTESGDGRTDSKGADTGSDFEPRQSLSALWSLSSLSWVSSAWVRWPAAGETDSSPS